MSQIDSWSLPGPSDRCVGCEAELAPGTEVTVVLSFGEAGPERRDLCTACGEAVHDGARRFYWRSVRAASGDTRPVVDYAFLREMFERMLARPETVYQRLTYLVGLVLVRKRFLRLKGFEARDGREVMVVARGGDDPDLEVPAPHLSAEDMAQTRAHLQRLLAADLPDAGEIVDDVAAEEVEAGTDDGGAVGAGDRPTPAGDRADVEPARGSAEPADPAKPGGDVAEAGLGHGKGPRGQPELN